jgi:membrane-associated protease RseP (regulator of RpoE activity)
MNIRNFARLLMAVVLAGATSMSWAVGDPWSPAGSQSGAYLGVMVEQVSPETASALHLSSGGTMIQNVDQDGPACHAGLKGGDVITAFNGKPVGDPEQFASMIHSSAPGSMATLTLIRDGKTQDVKVKLGDWKAMAAVHPLPPRAPMSPVMAAPMAMPAMPDVHITTPMVARSGIIIEPLSPQLAGFFGTPANLGVLVRSVDKGSPGSAAGLKAGDVIVKVNNESIHDMADWKRALKSQAGKLTLTVIRDKREQKLLMTLPANTSELTGPDWDKFELDMQAFSEQMKQLGPQFEANAREMARLDPKQIEAIHKQVEESMKAAQPEIKRQAEEWAKQSKEIQKQAEQISKDWAKRAPELARQAQEMTEQMKPSAEEMKKMTHDLQLQMKNWQPEFQKQMDELKKQLDEEMRNWKMNFEWNEPKQL